MTSTDSLHPRFAEMLREMDDSRRELVSAVRGLPADVRAAAPVNDHWSVAQIVEHLAIVEDGAGRLLTRMMKQAQEAGAMDTQTSSLLQSLDAFDVANPSKRIEAPEAVRPKGDVDVDEGLARLETVRERLVAALRQGSGLDMSTVSFPHPLFGPITGYQWMLLVSKHERRHVAQLHRQFTVS